jgi:UDP-N-acetylglucosamine transferase subunit ALG13
VSRTIPIIRRLKENNTLFLASDGLALDLLKREFPSLPLIELPGYQITYSTTSLFLHLAKQSGKLFLNICKEMDITEQIVQAKKIDTIISDHRLGAFHKSCRSIIIAHQINIQAPSFIAEMLASRMNRYFINQFDECWIPDFSSTKMRLSGKLSEPRKLKRWRYIGALSRLHKLHLADKYDISIILSGPEPLRTGLENKLAEIMQGTKWKLCWIRGTEDENLRTLPNQKSNTVIPLATSKMTEQVINQSKIVIARAGYSTIMDVMAVQKPAILIPTPGQTEQEYLALNLLNYSGLYFISEKELSLETIQRAMNQLLN